jgi:3-oxoacyl-[acyl-carrier-protein] synthase II
MNTASGTAAFGAPAQPVSIVGTGAVTGYGWGTKFLWDGLYSGQSADRRVPGFSPVFDDDWAWVAAIEDGGDPADGPSLFTRAARAAAREAVHDAHDHGWRPGPVVGLVHAQSIGDMALWSSFIRAEPSAITPRQWLGAMPSTVIMEMMREFGFHGPTMAVTAMCASGLAALITAKVWINAGICSDVLVVATDVSLAPENCKAVVLLGPGVVDRPSLEVCRPFQEGSRGFVGGEAAVGMVVSHPDQTSYAEILGGAMTHEAFHAVAIPPQAPQVRACMAGAIANAGLDPAEIAYLNAYGNGNKPSDDAEAFVFDELLTEADGLFAVKPLVGHCMGAAAAVETMATLFAFQTGVIPAPPRRTPCHPKLLDGPTACVEGPVLKTAFGFGGHNAAIVLSPGRS